MEPPHTPVKDCCGSSGNTTPGRKKPQSDSKKPSGRISNPELRAFASNVAEQLTSEGQQLLVRLWELGVDVEAWDDENKQCSRALDSVQQGLRNIEMPHNWQSELQLNSDDELHTQLRNVICAVAANPRDSGASAVKEFVHLCSSFDHSQIQTSIAALLASVEDSTTRTVTTTAMTEAADNDEASQQSRSALRNALLALQKLTTSSPNDRLLEACNRLHADCMAVENELSNAAADRLRNIRPLSDVYRRIYLLGKTFNELNKHNRDTLPMDSNFVIEAIKEEVSGSIAVHEASGIAVPFVDTATTTASATTVTPPLTPPTNRTPSSIAWHQVPVQVTELSALRSVVESVECPFHDAFLKFINLLQNHTPSKVWSEFTGTHGNAKDMVDSFMTLVLGSTCTGASIVKRNGLARLGSVQNLHRQFMRVFQSAGVVPRRVTTVAMDTFRGNETACRGLVDAVLQHLVLDIQELYPHAGVHYLPECGVTEGNGRPVDYMIFCGGKVIALLEVKADSRYRNTVSELATSSSMNESWAQLLAYAEQSNCDRGVELFLCATTGLLWQSAVYDRMTPGIQRGTVEDVFLVQDSIPRQTMNALFTFIVNHAVHCLERHY